jgi:hypothetical protein
MYWDINNVKASMFEHKDRRFDKKKDKWVDLKKPVNKFIKYVEPRSQHINVEDLIIFLNELKQIQQSDYDSLKFDVKFDIKFQY